MIFIIDYIVVTIVIINIFTELRIIITIMV